MLNVTIIPAVTFFMNIISETILNSASIKSYKMPILCRNGIMGMKFKFFSKKIAFTVNIYRYKLISGRQFDFSKVFLGFEFVFLYIEIWHEGQN